MLRSFFQLAMKKNDNEVSAELNPPRSMSDPTLKQADSGRNHNTPETHISAIYKNVCNDLECLHNKITDKKFANRGG